MRVILNSLPKSGTHLLTRFFDLLEFEEVRPGLAGGLIRKTSNNPLKNFVKHNRKAKTEEKGFHIDLDIPENLIKREWLINYLNQVEENCYLRGHLPYSPELSQVLKDAGYKHLYISRDPRDVLCSLSNFHTRDHKPFSETFSNLPPEKRRNLALFGVKKEEIVLSPLAKRLEYSSGWLNDSNVLCVKFEDLIGEKGGGSNLNQTIQIKNILDFVRIKKSENEIAKIADNLFFQKSSTFHKGTIGQWLNQFSDEEAGYINKEIGSWIPIFGYEI